MSRSFSGPGPVWILGLGLGLILLYQVGGLLLMSLMPGWGALLAQLLFLVLPALLVARWSGPGFREGLRLSLPGGWSWLLGLVIGLTAYLPVNRLDLWIGDRWPMPLAWEEAMARLLGLDGVGPHPAMLVAIVLGAALSEELVFRGLIQRSLEEGLGILPALGVTAVLFAASHANPFWFVQLTLFGLLLGWMAYSLRSIWPGVLAHGVHNALSYGLMRWAGPEVRPAEAVGTALTLLSACLCAAALWWIGQTGDQRAP